MMLHFEWSEKISPLVSFSGTSAVRHPRGYLCEMYPFAQFHFSKLTYNLLHFQRRVSALFCVSIFYGCFAIVVWLSWHMPHYIIGGYMAWHGRRGGLPAGACRGNVPQTCKQNFLPSVVASPGTRTKGVFACPAHRTTAHPREVRPL